MRRLGALLLQFRSAANDSHLTGKDMFDRTKFPILKNAIEQLTSKKGDNIKAGLKFGIGYLLIKCVKVLKGHYIIKGEFKNATEVEHVSSVLQLNWDFLFVRAQSIVEMKRQTVLRRPRSCHLKLMSASFTNITAKLYHICSKTSICSGAARIQHLACSTCM